MHKIRDEQGSGLDVPRSGGAQDYPRLFGSQLHRFGEELWGEPGHGGPSQKDF